MPEGFRITDRRPAVLFPPVPVVAPYVETRCMAEDPDPRPHVYPTCLNAGGHAGLHNWQVCGNEDPNAEYECQHSCELERDHDGGHRETFTWQ